MKVKHVKLMLMLTMIILSFANMTAQIVTLYTPNGSTVSAFMNGEMSSTDITYYTNLCRTAFPQAEIIANASATYNCHSYAWNITEGGTVVCWLNQSPDLHKYWDDKSYIETNEAEMEKVFYYNGDHSAIKSKTVIGKYESKWGKLPLMRHAPEYCPDDYKAYYRKYYKKTPPAISGPSTISGQATYTIHNLPPGATVLWSVSNTNLTQLSANGSSVVYRSDFYGECSIQATVSFNNTSINLTPYTVMADIDLGKLNNVYITGPGFVCGLTAEFSLKNLPDSSWVSWDHGAFTSDNSNPYTVNMSSFSGNPGIASVIAEIRYKGKPQGIVHKYNFSFNFPSTQYVEDSVIMNQGVNYDSYQQKVSASFAYLYPSYGINYEWSCSERDWHLVSGGTDYAMFEGPPVTGFITIKMSFTNPCGQRTHLIRELYLPDYLYGDYSPFKIVFDSSSNMLKIQMEKELANQKELSFQSANIMLTPDSYEIQIWSSTGMLKRYLTDQNTFQISLGYLSKGFYFVRVIKDNKIFTQKFVR